ncbi:L-seryl-tRNA(Sec) selenium transferase [Amaricoccus solimangrovi]|uniref:L-seryl-tRNA(Sec) selenium transferase n=1 Tax=Amaricoccus solimangrovi TaxID=2589815 RepID=A0A501WFA1_9RHOB|nr:L-seryl-tRNA(Sec) selenium transferase [Amaricoccus solimangrovi]TPE47482.1 L-seryl-tRNA(Sec) selenium transferase [Amaricoccus solimangrovi]
MSDLRTLPSVDEALRTPTGQSLIARHGQAATRRAIRTELDALRLRLRGGEPGPARVDAGLFVAEAAGAALAGAERSGARRVFNLTGTVLHTNLGRALYAEAAVEAATTAMRHPLSLEYDLDAGRRGQRDEPAQRLVAEITGAEDACVVNNNASAVLLVLAALAQGRETIVSRGELIEIGGSFRMPDVMASAGTRLREVGTTNRTHPRDYRAAIGPETALILKVHTSNYRVMGFTTEVAGAELAAIARNAGLPLVDDLGSGVLVDLSRWGVARERTVQEALADGADLVTFSGDKLLGGPQAGFIAGRRDLVRACAAHPLKRALRLDKVRLAALEATLRLYRHTERLAETLPTIRTFARTVAELRALAEDLRPSLAAALGAEVAVVDTEAQVGSGALPLETFESVALRAPAPGGRAERLASALRRLPIPVIGRIERDAVVLDLRCLDDAEAFRAQLLELTTIFPEVDLS